MRKILELFNTVFNGDGANRIDDERIASRMCKSAVGIGISVFVIMLIGILRLFTHYAGFMTA